jgi:plasmid maintenance system antidote protein VapI
VSRAGAWRRFEMERGKRPIGKAMARRLAKALGTSYKVFL